MSSIARDKPAGRLLRQWRLDRGLSPEQLSWAIYTAQLGHVTGRQLRRIEKDGVIPTPRVMFAIASYFETRPSLIWTGGRMPVAA